MLSIVLLMFLIPFVISLSYGAAYDWPRGRDERLYYDVGKSYVQGLRHLDFTVFDLNPEHPPLAKLVIGLLDSGLSYWGLDYFPLAVRLQTSLFLSMTCVMSFIIGKKIGGLRSGLTSWILLTPQFFLAPYGLWLGTELNLIRLGGVTPIFLCTPLDIPCVFFVALSMYFLLDLQERHSIFKLGLCYGLASLTKLIAVPTVPAIILLWLLLQGKKLGESLRILVICVAVGLVVFYVGNPAVWNPKDLIRPFVVMESVENTSTWYESFILNISGEDNLFFLTRFLMTILMYPTGLFVELYLVKLFTVLLLYMVLRRIPLSDSQLLLLIWFLTHYLFLSLITRTVMIGSYIVNYYAVQYFVPLALFCATVVSTLYQDFVSILKSFS